MRVEDEGCDAERKDGEPKVNKMRHPNDHGDVGEEKEIARAHVDTGTGKAGVEDGERDASGGETSTSCDVTRPSECQITENRIGVDLSRENLENRG